MLKLITSAITVTLILSLFACEQEVTAPSEDKEHEIDDVTELATSGERFREKAEEPTQVFGEPRNFPTEEEIAIGLANAANEDADVMEKGSPVKYTVWVKTAYVKHAGTDANVYLHAAAYSGLLPMVHLDDDDRDDHEKGNYDDHYPNTWKNINKGRIQQIFIGHDNKGRYPGWNLEYVLITKKVGYFPNEKTYTYKFVNAENDGWLATSEGDKKLERLICNRYYPTEWQDDHPCKLPYDPDFNDIPEGP